MASLMDLPVAVNGHTMKHMMEHVMKLTRNLLVLQKTGTGCDVTLDCKDGLITAHSGMEIQ